ncbi:MAG: hypothetical protein ACE5R6_00820 [Candidatus Heimdallarchaeota archaeon]
MPKKCAWCKEPCQEVILGEFTFRGTTFHADFCSLDHVEETRQFLKFAETHLLHFFFGLIVPGILGIILVASNLSSLGVFTIFAGIGITSIIFPFATSQTNDLLGFRKAIILVRLLGIIIIGLGILFGIKMS